MSLQQPSRAERDLDLRHECHAVHDVARHVCLQRGGQAGRQCLLR